MEKIKNLLQKVSDISTKYEEIAKITGENFNIFKVMNVLSDEVKLHSAFIAELLNPKGTHGQGDVFLKLFVEQLGVEDFDTKNATTKVEKNIGEKTETEGGRIDIVINSGRKNIFIENKIYAGDQPQQLLRYHNADKKADLFYLTLYGRDASEESTGKSEDKYYISISYSTDILNWLKKCKKETVNFPVLRETITQYNNIIKYLTGQTMNEKMKNEIKDLINDNYKAAKLVSENIYSVEISKLSDLLKDVSKELKEKLSDGWFITTDDDLSVKWRGLSIRHNAWNKNIYIKYQGQPNIYNNSSAFGFSGDKKFIDQEKCRQLIERVGINYLKKKSDAWFAFKYENEFNKKETIEKLFDDKTRLEIKNKIVEKFIDLANKTKDILVEK